MRCWLVGRCADSCVVCGAPEVPPSLLRRQSQRRLESSSTSAAGRASPYMQTGNHLKTGTCASRYRSQTNSAQRASCQPAPTERADSPRPLRLRSRAAVSPWRSGPALRHARRMRSSKPSANSRGRHTFISASELTIQMPRFQSSARRLADD